MIDEVILLGSVASLAAGLATGAGALPVLFTEKVSDRLLDVMLGFSAGVMLAATSFSLIIPAIDLSGPWVAVFGVVLGAFVLHLLDRFLPQFHPVFGTEGPPSGLPRIWLFILAITIHNFPEGLAVGVSFGTGDIAGGLVIALAIGLQNMPEGLAVALPLVREKWPRGKALTYAFGSGLAEPIAGVLGVLAVTLMHPLLPWGLAFAAGAMIYVVSDEIIPETHSRGYELEGTWGVIIGFIIMMFLDNVFG